jgi:hypothetical protein
VEVLRDGDGIAVASFPWGDASATTAAEARREVTEAAVELFALHCLPGLDLAPLAGKDLLCWCPEWDKDKPCPKCGGLETQASCGECGGADLTGEPYCLGCGIDMTGLRTIELCPSCEGTGFARHACHGDPLMIAANPEINFPWSAN